MTPVMFYVEVTVEEEPERVYVYPERTSAMVSKLKPHSARMKTRL